MANTILIIDDEQNICDAVRLYFENEGYTVKSANDGIEGMAAFKSYSPDIVLLDIMMPKMDGNEVCRDIRAISQTPIIMLTAKGETFDRILGLTLGADDYLTKPFEMKELSARIKAVLRRCQPASAKPDSDVLHFDNLEISLQKYEMKVNGKISELPPKELELVYFLASNINRVYTRDQLLDKVWGYDYVGDTRTVDVHIKRLREKLDGVSDKWSLKTVWGVGYKFEVIDN